MLKKNNFLVWKWHNFLMTGILLTFYPLLYFTDWFNLPFYALGLPKMLNYQGQVDSWYKWYLYGGIYTIAVLWGGIRFILQHKTERYQVIRTCTIMFVQVVFAFSIPFILKIITNWDYYFSYLWPLKEFYFYPDAMKHLPGPIIFYSFFASGILVPILAFFFGKRWYCSWVCGCGGLANTAGDVYRHYSSKTLKSWKFERFSIYSILIVIVLITLSVFIGSFNFPATESLNIRTLAYHLTQVYYIVVSFSLAGMLGVGLYPLYGTRVWCRFFCPMAALLGLFQKMGRFRITTQKDTCISCGNCSKYCEMGINVRSYAQRNLHIKRASCVGCGMCAHVCPRGVLRLTTKE